MFDCYHGSECPFDLWSPIQERSKVENVAFSVYAKHTQEMMDIIDELTASVRQGKTEVELSGYDDVFSEDDWNYIAEEVQRRLEQ